MDAVNKEQMLGIGIGALLFLLLNHLDTKLCIFICFIYLYNAFESSCQQETNEIYEYISQINFHLH